MRARATVLLFAAVAFGGCGSDGEVTGPNGSALRVISGANLADTIFARPAELLTVEVRVGGSPKPGATVRFEAVYEPGDSRLFPPRLAVSPGKGSGFADETSNVTDAQGHASAALLFGYMAGTGHVAIQCLELGLVDTVGFTIRPGALAGVRMLVGDTIVLRGGHYSIGAYATDRGGNKVQGSVSYAVGQNAASVNAAGDVTAGSVVGRGAVVVRSGPAVDTARFTVVPQASVAMFLTPPSLDGKIVTSNLDGSAYKALTSAKGTAFPSGSSTSDDVVYHEPEGGVHVLYVVNGAGVRRRLLDPSVMYHGRYPRFDPDGQHLYFSGRATDTSLSAIWRVRRDGTGLEHVVDLTGDLGYATDAQLDVSPDGSRIVYRDVIDVVVRTLATGATSVIGSYGTLPTFSPDGQHVAFVERASLVVTSPDGTGRTVLASGLARGDDGLTWLPDNRWLLLRTTLGPTLLDSVTGELVPMPSLDAFHQISVRR